MGTKRLRQNKKIIRDRDPLSNPQRCEFRILCNDLIKYPIYWLLSFDRISKYEMNRSSYDDSSQIYKSYFN